VLVPVRQPRRQPDRHHEAKQCSARGLVDTRHAPQVARSSKYCHAGYPAFRMPWLERKSAARGRAPPEGSELILTRRQTEDKCHRSTDTISAALHTDFIGVRHTLTEMHEAVLPD
jgi:hypothetical protein